LVRVKQSPLDRFLGIGTILVTTSSGEEIELESLPNSHETAELIRQMKEG
jgi:membrane protein YdbS with pleckstrin-like domain